jgi:Trk-type K+ transport system membrane component
MFNFLLSNIKNVGYMVVAFFTVYILKRNKDLSLENNDLTQENLAKEKELTIKKEILKIEENYKPTSLDDDIKRVLSKGSK